MCLICVDLVKQKMTLKEAHRAGIEIAMGKADDHNLRLLQAIEELDLEALDKILDKGNKPKGNL